MAGQIAEAFVRVRADTRGLKGEVEKGTKHAFSGVAKTVGGVFAVAGAAEAARHIAGAAASQQEELAVVRKAVADTGSAWVVQGHTVKEVLREQAVEFGFTVSDLAQGFTRIDVGTKNTAEAFRLLGLAEDVARARHLGLAQASVILTRAAQGNDVSLRRLGIIIAKVTDNVDGLKKKHDEAVAAGATFTKQQKLEYQNALATAAALDKQATKTKIVSEIQARFGGQAGEFAKTASGSFARLHESINEFEVALGDGLLPGLTRAALAGASFFKGLADDRGVQRAAAEGAHDLGAAAHLIAVGFREVAVVALPVGRFLKEVASFAGAGGILTAVAAYKSLGIVVGLNTAIQTRYAAVKAAGSAAEARTAITAAKLAGTQEGLAASTAASTAAIAANTEALLAQSAAQTTSAETASAGLAVVDAGLTSTTAAADATAASLAAVDEELVAAAAVAAPAAAGYELLASTLAAYDAELVTTAAVAPEAAAGIDAVAAAEAEAGAAGVAAGGGLALFGRGLASLVSTQTLVAVGIAGLAFVVYKMVTAESTWESANRTLRASIERLGTATKNLRDDEAKLADLKLEIPTLKAARGAAVLAVERDKLALANTRAAKGTLAYRQLENALAQDEAELASVTHDLAKAQGDAAGTAKTVAKDRRDQQRETAQLVKDTQALADVQKRLINTGFPSKANGYRVITKDSKSAADALAAWTAGLRKDATQEQKNYPLLARNARILADYAASIHRFPTKKETTFVLNLKKGQGFADVVAEFGKLDPGIRAFLASEQATADAASKTVKATAKTVKAAGDSASQTITTTVKDYASHVTAAVRDAQYQVAQAQQGLADTIRQGEQAVADSITSAKQNLNSIGASLADAIGRFLDAKGSGGLPASAALTKEFKHLKDLIASGADPETIKKASDEVKAQLDARAAAAANTTDASKAKDHVKTALANLTDLLNRGAITRAQFEKRVTALLRSEGITRANILKKLGVAAADEFSGLLTGLKQQADALVKGPRASGTGLIPAIVKPLDALKQAERDTAAAQHTLQVAQRDLAKQQLDEQKKAVAEAKKQAEQLAKIHAAQKGTAFTATLVAGKDGTYTFSVKPQSAAKPATKKAGGGTVRGPAGRDVVPAMLTAGELVFNEPQQQGLRGMLGLGSGSPEQLFQHVAGSSRFADGGVVGYASGGAAAPVSPSARRAEIKRLVEQTFTATPPQGARIASELLSLHLSKPELAFISRYSATAGDAAMRAKGQADFQDAIHVFIPSLAHAADVVVAGGVVGDIRHGRHGWHAGLDALSVIPLLRPVKALRLAVDAGHVAEAGSKVRTAVDAAETASGIVGAGAKLAPGLAAARAVRTKLEREFATVLYHGSPRAFTGFDIGRADPGALYGPGVYLTDSPAVASGYARHEITERAAFKTRQAAELHEESLKERGIWATTVPDLKTGVWEVASAAKAAPNVRIVRTNIAKPFVIEKTVEPAEAARLAKLTLVSTPKVADVLEQAAKPADRAIHFSGQYVYDLLSDHLGKAGANALLRHAGYDAIQHVGGTITGGAKHGVSVIIDAKAIAPELDSPLAHLPGASPRPVAGAIGTGKAVTVAARAADVGVPRLPWVEPPARLAVRKGTGAVGRGPTGLAPGRLGDVAEEAITKLGFRGTHPGSRLGDFDVAWDHTKNVFEVKARTTYGTEYKYGFKTAAREKKLAAAAREGLNPHTMIVVVDPDDGIARAYWRDGLSSSRLGREWNYAGSTKIDVAAAGKAQGGVARLAEGGVADRAFAPYRFGDGGVVPGPVGAGDIVPALLSPGELVVPRHQVAVESGSEIAYRQREAQLVEARRQTRLLERIADGQRSGDPRLARLAERVRDGDAHRSRSRAAEMAGALVGGTL